MALLPEQQAGDLVKAGYQADLFICADWRAKCLGGQRVVYVIWRKSSHVFLGSLAQQQQYNNRFLLSIMTSTCSRSWVWISVPFRRYNFCGYCGNNAGTIAYLCPDPWYLGSGECTVAPVFTIYNRPRYWIEVMNFLLLDRRMRRMGVELPICLGDKEAQRESRFLTAGSLPVDGSMVYYNSGLLKMSNMFSSGRELH
jgi:hypothetical protein